MFDQDFKYTLLGGAALIGLPVALIVAGTMAFANVNFSMPSFAKADPAQQVIDCYNEILETDNNTNCGSKVFAQIENDGYNLNDMNPKEKMEIWEAKGLTEKQAIQMAMVIGLNNVCSEDGLDSIANQGPKPKDEFEQFGHDFGMKLVTGMCGKFLSKENLAKLEKIG